jgi:hypothetical protein
VAPAPERSAATPARALLWLLAVGLSTGLAVGVLVVGPAGRLAMRLLAATSPDAQGRITEAGEVVGEVSLEGTLGFFVFAGLPFGLAVGLSYAVAAFVLPRGLAGGAVFGTVLLVVLGSRVDPLRERNPDFDLLGPGWLSVVAFAVMALLTGLVTAPLAARAGSAMREPRAWWLLWVLPVGLLAAAVLSATVPAALAAVAAGLVVLLAALLVPPQRRTTAWRRGRRTLQLALASGVAISAPGFLSAVSAIVE